MLDKKSKQVLKALNTVKNELNFVNGSDLLLPYLPKEYNRKLIDDVLIFLESKEYVQNQYAENTIVNIYVNYAAANYKEFNFIALKQFLLKSIITPIIVSAITAVITASVTLYLKK